MERRRRLVSVRPCSETISCPGLRGLMLWVSGGRLRRKRSACPRWKGIGGERIGGERIGGKTRIKAARPVPTTIVLALAPRESVRRGSEGPVCSWWKRISGESGVPARTSHISSPLPLVRRPRPVSVRRLTGIHAAGVFSPDARKRFLYARRRKHLLFVLVTDPSLEPLRLGRVHPVTTHEVHAAAVTSLFGYRVLVIGRRDGIADGPDRGEPLRLPRVDLRRLHRANVGPQAAVDTGADLTKEDADVHGGPDRTRTAAVSAYLVPRHLHDVLQGRGIFLCGATSCKWLSSRLAHRIPPVLPGRGPEGVGVSVRATPRSGWRGSCGCVDSPRQGALRSTMVRHGPGTERSARQARAPLLLRRAPLLRRLLLPHGTSIDLVAGALPLLPLHHRSWQRQWTSMLEVADHVGQQLGARPVTRVLREQPMHEILEFLGELRLRCNVPRIRDGEAGLVLERMPVEHEDVHNAPEHPDVHLLRYLDAVDEIDHLWWTVHHRRILLDLVLDPAELLPVQRLLVDAGRAPRPEVAEFEAPALGEEHVLNLQVTMGHRRIPRVQHTDRPGDVGHDAQNLLLRQHAALLF
mmetsp:Transcript_59432/g.165992  ORF Transcript_59432/g.165992 Transcript_59432/m.165992 type:complete len:580 (-) Transcript_59432:403-2142(-)